MKKTLFLLAAIAIACSFSACEKEGVYHPKKKISKIYLQGDGAKQLYEKWTWEGKNLIKISDATDQYYRKFTYEKDRIKKILWNDASYISFSYDGKFIKRVDYYDEDGALEETYNFTHTKSKITSVTVEYNDGKKSSRPDLASTLRLFLPLPEQAVEQMTKRQERPASSAKGGFATTYEYVWDGDNIKTVTLSQVGNEYYYSEEYTFQYDKNRNPFYYCFDPEEAGPTFATSKNNVILTEAVYSASYEGNSYSGTGTVEFDIVYDGKWPVEVLTMIREGGSTERYTTYYTYED
ncbi:MAG: hypothetical protein LBK03_07075 [Bacteroidales bacterium]|nr:hypothetical protein [Bacteroidales bacterium]